MPKREAAPAEQSRPDRPGVHCDECTIQIGDGYQEMIPFEFVDDADLTTSPKTLRVCWRCWESLDRRKNKRLQQQDLIG